MEMKMAEERAGKKKRFLWVLICSYVLIVAGYYLGRKIGETQGLEYRFWVDAGRWIFIWFFPVMLAGILFLKGCIRQWRRKSGWRWLLSVLFLGYAGVAAYLSLIYVFVGLFTLTFDEKMPDGNLVVAEPDGMESIHHYAEPVGLFFRRKFSFDEKRTAESLSRIYGITFQPLREENGEWIYGSDAYPGVEVTNIRYGFSEPYYLENNFGIALTSKRLEEHREVFVSWGIELVTYRYGQSEKSYTAVLISEENKEQASEAIAEFIRITLQEDKRLDGKSCWKGVNGSVILVVETEESEKYKSIRNIPFGLEPEYFWVFDDSVTAKEIAEQIEVEKEPVEAVGVVQTKLPDGETTMEESLKYYLQIVPACTFTIEGELEYRMVEVDRALGSSFYVMLAVTDQGKNCVFLNPDPYNGSGGEAKWITFLNENLGFSCLSHAAGSYGSLYRTEDGGRSWKEVAYPSAEEELPDGTCYNPFVMPEKVYEQDGILRMEVGQGTDGDYYEDGSFCHGLYQSADDGATWEYRESISVERE